MKTIGRRAVLGMPLSLMFCGSAAAKPRSYTATHGAAPFVTEHLIPGSSLDLAAVDLETPAARVIALTVDDGPDPNDQRIMEILVQRGTKATFFAIGSKVAARRDIIDRLVASGNEIGSHTQHHPMMTDIPATAQIRNLDRADNELARVGIRPSWFRPPYGDWDAAVEREARERGMQTVLWTVDSKDWKGLDAEALRQRVIDRLSPGAIILMHSTKSESVKALPGIIDEGLRRGYRFVTLTEWRAAMQQATQMSMALGRVHNHSASLPLN